MARSTFADFGNALYTGEKSIDFIGRRKTWYLIAAVMIVIAIVGPLLRGGFTFGIEFTGGSQFQIHTVDGKRDQSLAVGAVEQVLPGSAPRVSMVGQSDIRVQTEQLEDTQSRELHTALAEAYGVSPDEVTASYIGALWGKDITRQAGEGLDGRKGGWKTGVTMADVNGDEGQMLSSLPAVQSFQVQKP